MAGHTLRLPAAWNAESEFLEVESKPAHQPASFTTRPAGGLDMNRKLITTITAIIIFVLAMPAWGSGSIIGWGEQVVGVDLSGPFVQVAGGNWHSLGLKSDGSIVAWGWNNLGQCNVPAPNAGFVAVAAGKLHSLGLKSDGSIVAWGYNAEGQCDVPAPNSGFVAVKAVRRNNPSS